MRGRESKPALLSVSHTQIFYAASYLMLLMLDKYTHSLSLPSAYLQLSCTTSAPLHQTPRTSTKRQSLPVGSRETGPTLPPATFDSVPEEATETQPHPQLQTGALMTNNWLGAGIIYSPRVNEVRKPKYGSDKKSCLSVFNALLTHDDSKPVM